MILKLMLLVKVGRSKLYRPQVSYRPNSIARTLKRLHRRFQRGLQFVWEVHHLFYHNSSGFNRFFYRRACCCQNRHHAFLERRGRDALVLIPCVASFQSERKEIRLKKQCWIWNPSSLNRFETMLYDRTDCTIHI